MVLLSIHWCHTVKVYMLILPEPLKGSVLFWKALRVKVWCFTTRMAACVRLSGATLV